MRVCNYRTAGLKFFSASVYKFSYSNSFHWLFGRVSTGYYGDKYFFVFAKLSARSLKLSTVVWSIALDIHMVCVLLKSNIGTYPESMHLKKSYQDLKSPRYLHFKIGMYLWQNKRRNACGNANNVCSLVLVPQTRHMN